MPAATSLRIPRRALPARALDVAVAPGVRDALDLLCDAPDALRAALGPDIGAVSALRRGRRLLTLREAAALARHFREASARLQLAADALTDDLHADLGRVAHEAIEHALLETDKERAVELAVQAMFELYA